MKDKKGVTVMPVPESRNNPELLRLVADANQAQELPAEHLKMLNHPSILSRSNLQTEKDSDLIETPWGPFSRQPNYMGGKAGGSSTSEPSESQLQRRREIRRLLEEEGFFNTDAHLPPEDEETLHSWDITVRIFTYGKREKTLLDTLKELGRVLNHGFKDNFEMEWSGNRVEYDSYAHDGEHVDHKNILHFVALELDHPLEFE